MTRIPGSITLATLTLLIAAVAVMGPDAASASGACSASQARAAMLRERAEYIEAVRVYEATRKYAIAYGKSVARWTRLSRRVGWSWATMPTLMRVIGRESGGDPAVYNYAGSGAAGLLQLMPVHYSGRFSPTDPRANLAYGLRLWRAGGWSAWGVQ